jgi:hypothetical protein
VSAHEQDAPTLIGAVSLEPESAMAAKLML